MRLSRLLLVAPLTVLGVVFAIANRQTVRLSLNPFNPQGDFLSLDLPLFAALFFAVLLGMAIAGFSVWLAQSRWRRRARAEHREVVRLQRLAGKIEQAGKAGAGPAATA